MSGDNGDDDRGIACPRCGCRHVPVKYTRDKGPGRRTRVRECRYCGRRIVTHEQIAGARTDV